MRVKVFGISLGIFATSSMLLAIPAWSDVAGKVSSVSGGAEIQTAGAGKWKQAAVDDSVSVGDHLRTSDTGHMAVTYREGSVIKLEPGSELIVDDQSLPANGPPVSKFSLNRGKLDVAVPKGIYDKPEAKFEVKTVTAVAGVRGTRFTIEAK